MAYGKRAILMKRLSAVLLIILLLPAHCLAVTVVTHTIGAGKDYESLYLWSQNEGRNLVAADEIERVECYASMTVNSFFSIETYNWTTDPNHRIIITVAESDRHSGIWDDAKAKIVTTISSTAFVISVPYTTMEWLQIQPANNFAAIALSHNHCIVSNCIIRGTSGSGGIIVAFNEGCEIYRNIIYNCGHTTYGAINFADPMPSENFKAYSNTIYGCYRGITGDSSSGIAKNNAVFDCSNADFYGTFSASSGYNADSDGSAPGSNNQHNKSASDQFQDIGSNNFLLKPASDCTDTGYDLGSPYNVDIQGTPVSGLWDIGADEYTSSSGIKVIIMLSSTGRR